MDFRFNRTIRRLPCDSLARFISQLRVKVDATFKLIVRPLRDRQRYILYFFLGNLSLVDNIKTLFSQN